mgnify:CR=1 FL=1
MSEIFAEPERALLARQIDEWLGTYKANNPLCLAVGRDADNDMHWYVRMQGEEKEFTTVWLTLGQRTLQYETYVMPAPEAEAASLNEALLRRNDGLVGAHFSVGAEDAIYLRGALPVGAVSAAEVDRILGTMYALVERHFRALVRLGFPRLADR